nr:MAG TPA: hypothetical protein [Caudoviricetes sp.]
MRRVETALFIVIGILMFVAVIQKIMIEALSLYIKENTEMPDKQTISKYSEKAVRKFFHIPN